MPGSATAVWVDGEPCESLQLPDRGLDFGDGLFETFLLLKGQPLFPELHWQRLSAGLDRLGFPPAVLASVQTIFSRVLAQSTVKAAPDRAALRLTVTRGGGPRGYAPPLSPEVRTIIALTPIAGGADQLPAPLSLGLASIQLASQPALAGIKHLNRLEQVLIAAEASRSGVDEMLVLDSGGAVCSLGAANIFIVLDGRIVTPRLTRCGISGTRRTRLMEHWAPALGIQLTESAISVQQLVEAEEVFCTNSLRGIQPVGCYQDKTWARFPISQALHQQYIGEWPC